MCGTLVMRMASFLYWIGLYNLAGPLVLGAMHHEGVADFVLRRGTESAAVPYRHGDFGRMWLWWAATANGGLGAIMWLASGWPEALQRQICWVVLGVYAAMYVVLLVGGRGRQFRRSGILAVHGLWLGQMAWCGWAMWRH